MTESKPLIGIVSDRWNIKGHDYHLAGEKYLKALDQAADVYPVILPSLGEDFESNAILGRLDGLFLTGSPSNVEPHHYSGNPSREDTWHDPERDLAALGVIPEVIRSGLPMLAVCRGFQEINVALGGTLHQLIHEQPGYLVHKETPEDSLEKQYGPSHAVDFVESGLLNTLTGETSVMVNSLHSQAIDELADGLTVEARASDGLIEAFTVSDAPGFTLAVQWHPEWQVMQNPVSMALFKAFGDACRDFQK
jgi:putative glutamine amidotransferase